MDAEAHAAGECNVLVVSQLGGATKYKSDDNLIGLAHYLQKREAVPDMLVILGGAIPDIPKKGSRLNFNRLLIVERGVASIEDAAAVMKPNLERILKELPSNSPVVYAFGKEDIENIKHIEDTLMYEYNYNPEGVANRIKIMQEGISSRNEIIKSTIESRKALKSQLKGASQEERKELLEELENIEVKIRINKEERNELEYRAHLLGELYNMAIKRVDPKDVEHAIKSAKTTLKDIKRRMKELKEQGDAALGEYNRLKREAKWISVKIRALNQRLNESAENATIESLSKRKAQALIFTRQIPLSKTAAELIHEIAADYYKSTLLDAFGRKRNIIIQMEKMSAYNVKGYKVVVEGPAWTYTQKGSIDEGSMLYKHGENGFIEGLENEKSVLLVRGHSLYTSFKLKPLLNEKNTILAVLNQGPFLDLARLAKLYNLNIMTDETKGIEKGLMSSSASIVKLSEGTPTLKILYSELLKKERLESDVEEKQKLDELIKKIDSGSFEKESDGNGAFKEELQRAILANKRPSEIKDRELKYADEGLLLSLLRENEENEQGQKLKIACVQDLHIGNYPNTLIFKAALHDIEEKKPDVLLILGDIIDGNLMNYKNVPRHTSQLDDPEKFEQYLAEAGLSKEEKAKVMLEYYKERNEQRIYNIDEQLGLFLRPMLPIIVDIIKRNGYIMVASGNHYNKTEEGWQFDEATRIKDHINSILSAYTDLPPDWREHIKIAPGGEYGSETFYIDYKGKEYSMKISHELPRGARLPASLVRGKNSSQLLFSGHYHEPEVNAFNNKLVVYGASMQKSVDNPYLKNIGIPVTSEDLLNGYTYIEVELGGGRILAAEVENRLKNNLKDKIDGPKKEALYSLYRHKDRTLNF